jgi:hypothetical protein
VARCSFHINKMYTSVYSDRTNIQVIHLESREPGVHVTLGQCCFRYIRAILSNAMLDGSRVTTTWCILGLRIEEQGSCEYFK